MVMVAKPRVLVVYKKDFFQAYVLDRPDPHVLRYVRRQDPLVREMERDHDLHMGCVQHVIRTLKTLPVKVLVRARSHLRHMKDIDYVVAIGGDGTVLRAAQFVPGARIFGVNSDPGCSEGVYTCAESGTFEQRFKSALSGTLPLIRLPRIRLSLNGEAVPWLALNDVLATHPHPAMTSRYRLKVGGESEAQKSSGLWLATPSGSGGAVAAAGGIRLDWNADVLQYRPRELYRGRLSRPRLAGGLCTRRMTVSVKWMVREGVLCVDGAHLKFPLHFGDELKAWLSLKDSVRLFARQKNEKPRRLLDRA